MRLSNIVTALALTMTAAAIPTTKDDPQPRGDGGGSPQTCGGGGTVNPGDEYCCTSFLGSKFSLLILPAICNVVNVGSQCSNYKYCCSNNHGLINCVSIGG
ncbi:hypothetical protein B0I37DRAFT_364974 [Chaetomium sp. MPI-CAGE-AT-0009]|nr:hypothetical protein B0I37DRAFT_364974 [Chaetomium sp. MPI-CAGE-AT-0009]